MTELAAVAQPYPENKPWLDLTSYVEPSWFTGGPFTFWGMLDGNTAHLQLRTRLGSNATLAESIPEEFWPPRQTVLPGFSQFVSYNIAVFLETDGRLWMDSRGNNPADGNLGDFILQAKYVRKAA